jgi:ATP phosphoribosyltransferase regulatory subunit HisZ
MDSEEKVDLKALEKEHEKDMEEQKKREQELREKIKLNVAEMGRAEVEERMRNILTNPKMQRWVLNTFKDAAEREEYGKAQILLTALMKRKRELKKE